MENATVEIKAKLFGQPTSNLVDIAITHVPAVDEGFTIVKRHYTIQITAIGGSSLPEDSGLKEFPAFATEDFYHVEGKVKELLPDCKVTTGHYSWDLARILFLNRCAAEEKHLKECREDAKYHINKREQDAQYARKHDAFLSHFPENYKKYICIYRSDSGIEKVQIEGRFSWDGSSYRKRHVTQIITKTFRPTAKGWNFKKIEEAVEEVIKYDRQLQVQENERTQRMTRDEQNRLHSKEMLKTLGYNGSGNITADGQGGIKISVRASEVVDVQKAIEALKALGFEIK